MKEGEKIYVESLLSDDEYKTCAKLYPNTYSSGNKKPAYFKSEMMWRYRMGSSYTLEQIKSTNKALNDLLIKSKVKTI
jgi:hypothetical protein